MANESKHQIERKNDVAAAASAVERADTQELHVLFGRALHRYDEMEAALEAIVAHYAGSKEMPRPVPSNDNAIAAMERIASEAIAIARFVVETAGK